LEFNYGEYFLSNKENMNKYFLANKENNKNESSCFAFTDLFIDILGILFLLSGAQVSHINV